jgi:hypothetical protein
MHIGFWCKSQKERPLGRPECRWEDNIKVDLRDTAWGGMVWTNLVQGKGQR